MPVQSGSSAIASGARSHTVTFPVAYVGTAPELVLPGVKNNTNETPQALITAFVTEVTLTTFTVQLSGTTPSANYELMWWAGSAADALAMVTFYNQTFSQQPVAVAPLGTNDRLVLVRMSSGLPRTQQVRLELLDLRWVRRQTVPATPETAGTAMDLAIDADYLYARGPSYWHRIPLNPETSFADDQSIWPTRRGVVSLATADGTVQSFTFATPFSSGDPPIMSKCQIQNLSADSDKFAIVVLPSSTTLSGFTVMLSAIPPSDEYQLFYEAVQSPP